jgi:hypothetical protein
MEMVISKQGDQLVTKLKIKELVTEILANPTAKKELFIAIFADADFQGLVSGAVDNYMENKVLTIEIT